VAALRYLHHSLPTSGTHRWQLMDWRVETNPLQHGQTIFSITASPDFSLVAALRRTLFFWSFLFLDLNGHHVEVVSDLFFGPLTNYMGSNGIFRPNSPHQAYLISRVAFLGTIWPRARTKEHLRISKTVRSDGLKCLDHEGAPRCISYNISNY
jgi:hypothetical protein